MANFSGIEALCMDKIWNNGSFFSDTETLNYSVCFQHTVLVFIPCCFLWVLFPFFLHQIYRVRKSHRFDALPWSKLVIVKLIITVYLIVNGAFILIIGLKQIFDDGALILFLYPLLITVTMIAVLICSCLCRSVGVVSSGVIHITWLLFSVCGAFEFGTSLQRLSSKQFSDHYDRARCIAFIAWYPLIIIQMFLHCFADPRTASVITDRRKHHRSSELDSSFLNRLTLWWFTSIQVLGSRRNLEVDDLYQLNKGSTSAYLYPLWQKLWQPAYREYMEQKRLVKESFLRTESSLLDGNSLAANGLTKSIKNFNDKPEKDSVSRLKRTTKDKVEPTKPSIVWRLFLLFKFEILSATFTKVLSDALQFASPFLLDKLIGYISNSSSSVWQGVSFAVLMFICAQGRSFLLNYYFYLMMRVGIKIQTTLTAAVYDKTLKLSSSARKDKTVGEIVNLMAIDIERFQMITTNIQQFWSCPFQITLALIYLFYTLGVSAACGIFIMILFLPINVIVSVIVKRWQIQQMKLKDERAKMCNEILNGIKVIKLYAWEPPMETVVERIRQKELSLIKRAGLVRAIADSFNTASPFLVALLTFTTYTLISDKNALTPQLAFVSLTLFNQLRSPMTMISYLIQQTVQAIVANKRLKDFLVADEIDSSAILRTPSDKLNTVELEKASFTWGKGDTSNLFSLQNVNLNVPQGSLFAIVGPVGCGKSSLLSAILGEMEKLSGHAAVRGRISYVPQQPWIQNMTLRENIIFGKEFDPVFYDRVIDSCALRQDISMLPQGDSTEIGEKGINLSGGQKARVSLARAVYQNNDLYLLDDPLSAVDSHVGSHIFNEVIGPNGLLRNKTRILVTHGLSFTKDVDKIVIINDGKIAEIGTYNALLESRDLFSKLMEEMKSQGEENNDEPETAEELDTEENDKSTDVLNTQFDRDEGSSAVSIHLGRSRRISTVSDLAREAFGTAKRSKNERLSSLSEESTVKLNTKVPLNGKGSKAAQLIETERTETGRVKFSVYVQYIRAATIMRSALFCLFFASFSGFQLGRSLWLANWSDANDNREDVLTLGLRLGVYAAFGVCEVCGFALSIYFLVIAGLHASRNLHFPLLHSLLRSPMSFFDTTPLGRILNRFGKDIDIIDQLLPINFRFFVMCILQVFSTVLAIMLSTPVFAAVVLPLGFIYYASLRFYVPTSRQIKRLQSITRSPIYSHFGETIQGAASVRAYQMTDSFRRISEKKVDTFIQCAYLTIISNRWLAIRLEFVGNCTVLFAALFAALARDWGMAITAGAAGLSVSYALNVTETLNFAVRQVSELETNIVAVERVKEYAEVSTEAEWKIDDHAPPKNWPSEGGIALQNYSVRYRDGLDLVLKNIDLQVLPCEKIAIVGRTGAGKSSLTLALFRMIEASGGKILIDGINIAQIGLHDLRSRLSIIPQDPVLFSGSLRFNLDPFHSYSDHEIWEAIELAHLSAFVSSLADGLNHVISEGGENISVGQRQLVCLARALLRKSRVLILDEATAAVDMATDALIQETIRKQFRSSTVISIAHRLITILDYDRIVVLDKGRISEVDTPQNLLANRYSVFHSMAVEAKIIS